MRKIYIPPHRPLWLSPEERKAINKDCLCLIALTTVFAIGLYAADWIYMGVAS